METTVQSERQAVAFVRVNATGAGSPDAVQQQFASKQAQCEATAQEHGVTISREYRETGGAVSMEQRPELLRLLADVQTGKVGHVIVTELSQLSRNMRDAAVIENRLAEAGATLLVCGASA